MPISWSLDASSSFKDLKFILYIYIHSGTGVNLPSVKLQHPSHIVYLKYILI